MALKTNREQYERLRALGFRSAAKVLHVQSLADLSARSDEEVRQYGYIVADEGDGAGNRRVYMKSEEHTRGLYDQLERVSEIARNMGLEAAVVLKSPGR